MLSKSQWPVSCSSCGCHTKWPPPTSLFISLIHKPGYRARSISSKQAIHIISEEEIWVQRKWNCSLFTQTWTSQSRIIHITTTFSACNTCIISTWRKIKTKQFQKIFHERSNKLKRTCLFLFYCGIITFCQPPTFVPIGYIIRNAYKAICVKWSRCMTRGKTKKREYLHFFPPNTVEQKSGKGHFSNCHQS